LFDCPSIEALVEYLAATVLAPRLPQTAQAEAATEPDADWADVEELSEEEADALLRQELADTRYAD
jgi:hypothetical protein